MAQQGEITREELSIPLLNELDGKTSIIVKNDLLTTVGGDALDATQGKILSDKINDLSTNRGYVLSAYTTDVNNLTSNGKYRIYNATNAPTTGSYTVDVTTEGDVNITQMFIGFSGLATDRIFVRTRVGGVWSVKEITTTDNSANNGVALTVAQINDINLKSGMYSVTNLTATTVFGITMGYGFNVFVSQYNRNQGYPSQIWCETLGTRQYIRSYTGVDWTVKQIATTDRVSSPNGHFTGNMNTLIKGGTYLCFGSGSTGTANTPDPSWGTVSIIEGGSGAVTQEWVVNDGTKRYFRHYDGVTWAVWRTIANAEKGNITLLNGWTVTQQPQWSRVGNTVTVSGRVTGGVITQNTPMFTLPATLAVGVAQNLPLFSGNVGSIKGMGIMTSNTFNVWALSDNNDVSLAFSFIV